MLNFALKGHSYMHWSRIRAYISSLLLFLFCLLGPINSSASSLVSGPQAPSLAPQASSPFGVAGVMRWPDWGSFSRPADTMLQTGGSWVREDFSWASIEPRQGRQDWTAP